MKIQVVTDSTSDIPRELAENLGVRIVPIYVHFGDKTYRDGVDIQINEFYSMLENAREYPATSQPNTEDFMTVYKDYCDKTEGIVSIHISSKISGTYNSATTAKNTLESKCPIEVIDSKLNSGGLGLVVMAAARAARSGMDFTEVIREARQAVNEVRMFGMFETMKYLARSGRVNKTIATASRILNVIPLLTFRDGEIIRAGLVRSTSQGMDKIYDFVKRNTPISELVIVHSQAADSADQLKQRLGEFIQEEKISISKLGTGLGVHGGPGVLLAAVRRSEIKE